MFISLNRTAEIFISFVHRHIEHSTLFFLIDRHRRHCLQRLPCHAPRLLNNSRKFHHWSIGCEKRDAFTSDHFTVLITRTMNRDAPLECTFDFANTSIFRSIDDLQIIRYWHWCPFKASRYRHPFEITNHTTEKTVIHQIARWRIKLSVWKSSRNFQASPNT